MTKLDIEAPAAAGWMAGYAATWRQA